MSRGKVGIALGLLLAALVGGVWLTNTLTLRFLDLPPDTPSAWNLWWLYMEALAQPAFAPYALKVQSAGAIGFSLPLLAWAGLLNWVFKSKG